MTWTEPRTTVDLAPTDGLDLAGVDRAALEHLDLDTISVGDLAAWLAAHGVAHLSAMERVELAERLTRRRFLIGAGALGLGVITGCGTEEQAAAPTATGETRTVEHLLGTTEVPIEPQRIVACSTGSADHALVLDLPLIAAPGTVDSVTLPFLAHQREIHPEGMAGVVKIQGYTPNYEQIAALNPDCIFASDVVVEVNEGAYELLSEIAPTFVHQQEGSGSAWKAALRAISEAFGRQQEADRYLADYEARAEELRERLAERWSGATFVTVQPFNEFLYVFGAQDYLPHPVFFEELGLTPAAIVAPQAQELSLEALPEIDADVLFFSLGVQGSGSMERDRELATIYLDSPLWQAIPAVQKNQVYEFANELVFPSPLTAAAFLDVVEQTLLS